MIQKVPPNIALVSLGCAKNMVDAECMSHILVERGFRIVSDPATAQILVVNTCGFIESAKQEAIDTILALADFKAPTGKADFLIVTGCLAERYKKVIQTQMPEIDAVLGVSEYENIADTIDQLYKNNISSFRLKTVKAAENTMERAIDGRLKHLRVNRKPSTIGYAYIKIAEGCSNHCSYCAIPGIRGPFISRPFADIVEEAHNLSLQGYVELILIAQDTTRYGIDLSGRQELPRLLKAIAAIDTVKTIRILYAYADGINNELINCMAQESKILHYLDIPIQHAADSILKKMNRRDTQQSIRMVIHQLRDAIPDIVLRSTVMVGFPGETAKEFNELLHFLQEIRFDRLGCFIFSPEEGTPAEQFHPRVRSDVAKRRESRVMTLQQKMTREVNENRIGSIVPVLLEQVDEDGIFYRGRSFAEAPEVDPIILVADSNASAKVGGIYLVRLLTASEYEMTGETVQ